MIQHLPEIGSTDHQPITITVQALKHMQPHSTFFIKHFILKKYIHVGLFFLYYNVCLLFYIAIIVYVYCQLNHRPHKLFLKNANKITREWYNMVGPTNNNYCMIDTFAWGPPLILNMIMSLRSLILNKITWLSISKWAMWAQWGGGPTVG